MMDGWEVHLYMIIPSLHHTGSPQITWYVTFENARFKPCKTAILDWSWKRTILTNEKEGPTLTSSSSRSCTCRGHNSYEPRLNKRLFKTDIVQTCVTSPTHESCLSLQWCPVSSPQLSYYKHVVQSHRTTCLFGVCSQIIKKSLAIYHSNKMKWPCKVHMPYERGQWLSSDLTPAQPRVGVRSGSQSGVLNCHPWWEPWPFIYVGTGGSLFPKVFLVPTPMDTLCLPIECLWTRRHLWMCLHDPSITLEDSLAP